MELIQSLVRFDEESHIYTLEGFPLSGITSIIREMLFPDKYNDVPPAVLERAAKHGHEVHHAIEMYIKQGQMSVCEELDNFISLCGAEGIEPIASEYLVSDRSRIASCIDIVDSHNNLYDIKTTYTLDREYVSWQLSIYAWLFELQTKQDAGKLFALHLRNGKARLVEVNRKSSELCQELVDAYFNNTPFNYVPESYDIPADRLTYLSDIRAQLKASLEEVEKQITEEQMKVMELMKEYKTDELEYGGWKIKYSPATTRTTFDSLRFKKEHEDVYKQYTKTSNIAESLRLTLIS